MKEKNLTIRINEDIKNSFKDICDKESTTMSNKINDFIVCEVLNKTGGYIVFYMENETIDGEIKINLKQRLIPVNLKDSFLEKFKEKIGFNNISGEEIEKFLEENKK